MGEFFGSIYCIFENFFGQHLANYLWGDTSPFSTTNQFISIGLWMFFITALVAVIYYYGINHPRLNNWWGWLISLGVNAIINFIVGWQIVLNDYYDGKMVYEDEETEVLTALDINTSEILRFGVANMLLSIAVFFLISMCIKWWSNCNRSPF